MHRAKRLALTALKQDIIRGCQVFEEKLDEPFERVLRREHRSAA